MSILVPNAGLALGVEPVHELGLEDFRTMLDTNVMSVVALTRAFTPAMVARNAGHLIFMSRCVCVRVCVYVCVGGVGGGWGGGGGGAPAATQRRV